MSEEPLTHVYLCSDVSEPLGCFDVISGTLPPDQSVYTHTPPGRRRFVVVNLYDECVASTEQDVPGGREAIFKVVSYEGDMAWGETPTCVND
jgi:hypothetical protein